MSSSPFRIHILGCGSATPSLRHNLSSQVIEMRDKFFMVDCGEGTQLQLRRHHLRFSAINAIFITHLHGDHCFGLIGMISTFGLVGREAPLNVYAPAALEAMLQSQIEMFCPNLDFEVRFHPIDTTVAATIYDDRSLTVATIPLNHRTPCCGYLFREKPTLPHIDRAACDFYGVPISQFQSIKEGHPFVTSEEKEIAPELLTKPADEPRSYAYCSDTAYKPDICGQIHSVNLLYHEATYDDSKAENCKKYFHSTAREAALIAREAEAKQLMIGHFSARYDDESPLLAQAREVFPNTFLADERVTPEII